MNYIFLDVDGVLNNKKHYSKQHKKYGGRYWCEEMPFNPRSLKNLRRIVNKTGAKIVVSSSWRKSNDCMVVLNARLKEYGMEIHSTTMNLYSRGEEITHWCEENLKENDKILIIDDEMYDILEYYNNDKIVKLNGNDGLTFWKTLEAINKLKEE